MLSLAVLVASLLTVLPVFVVLGRSWRRDADAATLGLGVPLAVAVDLLVVLLLARVVRLEIAVLVSRAGWLVAAGTSVVQRPTSPRGWPAALTPRLTATVAGAAMLAYFLSTHFSRPYVIWDRDWHIPLVGSLRGQRLPFMNVYDRTSGLHYHFSGDVLASMVQVLSGCTLHSSLALSVAHDLLFAETGAALVLLFAHLGVRGVGGLLLAVLAVLLDGPATVLLDGGSRPASGYSLVNYLQLSFRPHVALAGLLFAGILGAVLVRLHAPRGTVSMQKTAPVLLASVAVLSITDETSTGLLGLAIGAAWVVEADVLAPRRVAGIATLAGMLASVFLANRVFAASFAPGAQHHKITIMPWRAPGFGNSADLALTTPQARWTVIADFFPVAVILLGGALLLAARPPRRLVLPSFVALLCLSAAAFLCVTRIDIDSARLEGHRFATAALYTATLFGVVWAGAAGQAPGLAASLVYGAIALASVSTVEWALAIAPSSAQKSADFHKPDDLHAFSCHDLGSSLADRPEPTYIDPGIWNLYAGCRPVFAPAAHDVYRELQTRGPIVGEPAFTEVARLAGTGDMNVVCATPSVDPICLRVLPKARCERAGVRAVRCKLAAADR